MFTCVVCVCVCVYPCAAFLCTHIFEYEYDGEAGENGMGGQGHIQPKARSGPLVCLRVLCVRVYVCRVLARRV